ncbi:MAG: hypothetical protein AAFN93_20170 [Bacteroidota bacterium]
MAVGLVHIWKQAKGFGLIVYPFRIFSYLSGGGLIIAHHYEAGLTLSPVDYFVLLLSVLIPHYYLIQYVRSGNNMSAAIKHMIIDFFLLGFALGSLNLSILPSFIFTLAMTLNFVSVTGYRKLYSMLLIPIGFAIVFMLDGFNLHLGYGNLVTVLSLSYGTVHFLILAFVSFNYANRYNRGQKLLKARNQEVEKQKEEILLQSQKLNALNNSLKTLNDQLEEKVNLRTKELKEKNKKLTEYAFINAHKLRAPVASIMGLVELFTNYKHTECQEQQIKVRLKDTVSELEETIVEIRRKLEEEDLTLPMIQDTSTLHLDQFVDDRA